MITVPAEKLDGRRWKLQESNDLFLHTPTIRAIKALILFFCEKRQRPTKQNNTLLRQVFPELQFSYIFLENNRVSISIVFEYVLSKNQEEFLQKNILNKSTVHQGISDIEIYYIFFIISALTNFAKWNLCRKQLLQETIIRFMIRAFVN